MITILIILINIIIEILKKYLMHKYFFTKRVVYYDLFIIMFSLFILLIIYLSRLDANFIILNKIILGISIIFHLYTIPKQIK